MAKSVNKVVLLGNVGTPPSIRNTRSGIVAEFSLATNERRPDGHGGGQDHTEWHTLIGFGRIAEIISECVHVGEQVFVEGKLRTESWDDTNAGIKRYWTKVAVMNIVLLSSRERQPARQERKKNASDFTSPYANIPDGEITPDEIPF